MTEAGHRILLARANKIKHRADRPLRRSHRSNSFDDEDALGEIIQHPTDKYESDEEDEADRLEEERAKAEYEERIERLKKLHAANQQQTAPPPPPVVIVQQTPQEIQASYESKLTQVNDEIRTIEAQLKKSDLKVKALSGWKARAFKTNDFSHLDNPEATNPEFTEPTKLRYYDSLITQCVSRYYLRNFKLRKMVKQVHGDVSDLVHTYIEERSGLLGQQEAERRYIEEQVREQQRHLLASAPHSELFEFHPSRQNSRSSPDTPSYLPPKISPLTGLPETVPPFYQPQPSLVGSLTDDTTSTQPLSILTSAVSFPSDANKGTSVKLQSEINTWLITAEKLIRNNYRMKVHTGSTSDEETFTGLREIVTGLADSGPILRCMLEEMLNEYGESQATCRSFHVRTKELQQRSKAALTELKELEEDHHALEQYLHLNLTGLIQLLTESNQVKKLLEDHQRYEARLRKTHATIASFRDRRRVEERKVERASAAKQAGRLQGTGGLGISSTLLKQVRQQRELEEEQDRIQLLQEIMKQQELSMQSVAASAAQMNEQAIRENNPEFFAVGAGKTGAGAKAAATPADMKEQYPPGLEELIQLLDDSNLSTPYLTQYVERKKVQFTKALKERGFKHVNLSAKTAVPLPSSTSSRPTSATTSDHPSRSNSVLGARSTTPQPTPSAANNDSFLPSGNTSNDPAILYSNMPHGSGRTGHHLRSPTMAPSGSGSGSGRDTPNDGSITPRLHRHSLSLGAPRGVGIYPTTYRIPEKVIVPPPPPPVDPTPIGAAKQARPSLPASTLSDQLRMHNELATSPTPIPLPTPRNEFVEAVPLFAYPSPPVVKPITVPVITLPPNPHPQHLYVPTQLIGGLTIQAREKEMYRLKNSPYMTSTLMTPQEEMQAIEDMGPSKAKQPKKSVRGSKPIKANPLAIHHQGQLPIGADSTVITRQKLAQQKLRLEKSIYEAQLFEGQNY